MSHVIAPVRPSAAQINRAAHAILNRAPTPDEYRQFFETYQEMLHGCRPAYGHCILPDSPTPLNETLNTDPDSILHQLERVRREHGASVVPFCPRPAGSVNHG